MLYIPIDKEAIPYQFDIEIAGESFTFDLRYNERFDFFTVDLYKDGELVVYGEKVVYGRALFSTYPDDSKIPKYPIVPLDEAGKEDKVTYANLGETVFLFIGDPNE